MKHRVESSWGIRAASFSITQDSVKDHKAHFCETTTQEQSLALPPRTERDRAVLSRALQRNHGYASADT